MRKNILKERFFNKMQGVFEVLKNTEIDYDINFNIIPEYASQGIPEKQQKLYISIERVTSIIKCLKGSDKRTKDKYFDKSLSIAQVGLTGTNAQPELAIRSLEALKEEIILNEGERIKNEYMKCLGIYALIIIFISILVIFIFNHYKFYLLNKYVYTFQGAMVGTWISFGARKVELKFEELSIIEKDRLNPKIRLIFVGISSIILLLFINSGIITFSVGGFKSKDIPNSIELQFLIGIISGLLEYKISIGIFKKASSIIEL